MNDSREVIKKHGGNETEAKDKLEDNQKNVEEELQQDKVGCSALRIGVPTEGSKQFL